MKEIVASQSVPQPLIFAAKNAITAINAIMPAIIQNTGFAKNAKFDFIIEYVDIGSDTYIINAEFPSANDVNSIKEAILSLPNLASQAANKNKK